MSSDAERDAAFRRMNDAVEEYAKILRVTGAVDDLKVAQHFSAYVKAAGLPLLSFEDAWWVRRMQTWAMNEIGGYPPMHPAVGVLARFCEIEVPELPVSPGLGLPEPRCTICGGEGGGETGVVSPTGIRETWTCICVEHRKRLDRRSRDLKAKLDGGG